MGKLFNKQKSHKEKLQELKDLANGKTTIEQLGQSPKPGRSYMIDERPDGTYEVVETGTGSFKQRMNQEEYKQWRSERDFTNTTSLLILSKCIVNKEIVEEETYISNEITWKEKRQYTQSSELDSTQSENIPPRLLQPFAAPSLQKSNQSQVKKKQPVKAKRIDPHIPKNLNTIIPMSQHEEYNRRLLNKLFG